MLADNLGVEIDKGQAGLGAKGHADRGAIVEATTFQVILIKADLVFTEKADLASPLERGIVAGHRLAVGESGYHHAGPSRFRLGSAGLEHRRGGVDAGMFKLAF